MLNIVFLDQITIKLKIKDIKNPSVEGFLS